MILHNDSLILGAEGVCDILALLITEDDPSIIGIDGQVVVEKTSILLHDIDGLSK